MLTLRYQEGERPFHGLSTYPFNPHASWTMDSVPLSDLVDQHIFIQLFAWNRSKSEDTTIPDCSQPLHYLQLFRAISIEHRFQILVLLWMDLLVLVHILQHYDSPHGVRVEISRFLRVNAIDQLVVTSTEGRNPYGGPGGLLSNKLFSPRRHDSAFTPASICLSNFSINRLLDLQKRIRFHVILYTPV